MTHDLEGICDVCGSHGLVGDICPCGGVYHDLNVGVEENLDDDPDTYPKSALKDDDEVISLDEVEKIETASQGDENREHFE